MNAGEELQLARAVWAQADREMQLRLDSVSLIAELDRPEDVTPAMVAALQTICRAPLSVCRTVVETQPFALAVLLVRLCVDAYDDATYWPHVWEILEVAEAKRPQLRATFGETFLEGLRMAGLPTFPELPQRFVGPILMHAGVPVALVPTWLQLIDDGTRHVGPDADLIAAWARHRFDVGGLPHIHKPLRRFLQQGGPFAADLLGRSVELLWRIRAGDPVADLGLPLGFEAGAHAHVGRAPAPGWKRTGIRQVPRPRLRLRSLEGRVVIELPEMVDAVDQMRWRVKVGEHVTEITPLRIWWGSEVRFQGQDAPVDVPARTVEVSALGLDRTEVIPVVADEELPLVAFDGVGERLDARRGIPAELVWLITPHAQSTQTSTQIEVTGGRLVLDLGSPVGWRDWRLQQWDLTSATTIQVGNARVQIASQARAQVQVDEQSVIDGVLSRGLPTLERRPFVRIPDGHATWRIEVADYATGKALHTLEAPGGSGLVDPFTDAATPVIGAFTITCRGPLGRGSIQSVGVAEGLSVTCSPKFRVFTRDGLEPASARLTLARGLAEPGVLAFDTRTMVRSGEVSGSYGSIPITVRPPALLASTQVSGGPPAAWAPRPVTVFVDELDRTDLLLRLAKDVAPALQVCRGSTVLQEVEATGFMAGRNVAYSLARIVDTVASGGANTLTLGTEAGQLGIRVASIRPKQLASGVEVASGQLRLLGCSGTELEATLWSTGCPQLPPVVRDVGPEGIIRLREGDSVAGRVAVKVSVRDDWAIPEPVARFPFRGSFLLTKDALEPTPDDVAAQAAAWLSWASGPALLGAVQDSNADLLWSAFLLDFVMPDGAHFPQETLLAIGQRLRREPADAVAQLITFELIPPVAAAALLQTGLAGSACWGRPADDSEMAAGLHRDPLSAALRYLPHIVANRAAYPDAVAALRDSLGQAAADFVETGADPSAREGAWGQAAERLDIVRRHEPAQFEAILAELSLRPVGVLHGDNRVLQSLEVLSRRTQRRPRELARQGSDICAVVLKSLRASGLDRAAAAIEARGVDTGWRALSAASLAWAIALRYGTRGHELGALAPQVPAWRHNVHAIAPLMGIDLVLAEIHAAHDFPLEEGPE